MFKTTAMFLSMAAVGYMLRVMQVDGDWVLLGVAVLMNVVFAMTFGSMTACATLPPNNVTNIKRE